mgnify:CR=1 FL=1
MRVKGLLFLIITSLLLTSSLSAQDVTERTEDGEKAMLLTIFLKHDQAKTLGEIGEQLDKTGFWETFPPEGTEVVSWYVMMGLGQVVTLRVPPDKLRAVNVAIERNAWNAFRTEFYPTYNFMPIFENMQEQQSEN